MITVDRPGPLALVQDLGRPGLAGLGVSPSGAADREALRLANRLVGNPVDAAAIEATLGGLVVGTDTPVWCAVTGPAVRLALTGTPGGPLGDTFGDTLGDTGGVGSHRRVLLEPGRTLELGVPGRGLRSYLAVRGGIAVPPVLGSRSADLLSGLGPSPLGAGDRLAVGPEPSTSLPPPLVVPPPAPVGELWLTAGPRRDRLTPAGWRMLLDATWEVSSASDRVGLRLTGPPLTGPVLTRPRTDELPSEGMIRGALQLPPSGLPVVFGPDHPVTGGYPVVAVLTAQAADASGQLRAGDRIRLRHRPADPALEPGAGPRRFAGSFAG